MLRTLRILSATLLLAACDPASGSERSRRAVAGARPGAASAAPRARAQSEPDEASAGPVRVEPLRPNESPPTFVQRGPAGPDEIVFLHGMCGHGLGYLQSFQFAGSKRGRLIAPQGDVSCGGPWSSWSHDLAALDRRIADAFRALGREGPLGDVVVIGYSQGATRAEALARRYPERYTRLILMGAPSPTSTRGLSHLTSTVMMAGERDRQDIMKGNVRRLLAAGIPSTFIELPEATHGAMGPEPERSMGAAFDWLYEHSRPRDQKSHQPSGAALPKE